MLRALVNRNDAAEGTRSLRAKVELPSQAGRADRGSAGTAPLYPRQALPKGKRNSSAGSGLIDIVNSRIQACSWPLTFQKMDLKRDPMDPNAGWLRGESSHTPGSDFREETFIQVEHSYLYLYHMCFCKSL